MTRALTIVPEESDLLCEGCGYTLNGLPSDGNCPECGKPIVESVGQHRSLSDFEQQPSWPTFLKTTRNILLRPKHFFLHLSTRAETAEAKLFSRLHLAASVLLFSLVAFGHFLFLLDTLGQPWDAPYVLGFWIIAIPFMTLALPGLTRLATWLSAIEAKYWGMRLPYPVVRRGLLFHRASYFPVAILANIVVWGFRWMIEEMIVDATWNSVYLYTLCGVVVVSAIYLFQAYWIAMRNMMYANK
jgi:hypothetical protein